MPIVPAGHACHDKVLPARTILFSMQLQGGHIAGSSISYTGIVGLHANRLLYLGQNNKPSHQLMQGYYQTSTATPEAVGAYRDWLTLVTALAGTGLVQNYASDVSSLATGGSNGRKLKQIPAVQTCTRFTHASAPRSHVCLVCLLSHCLLSGSLQACFDR